jgi:hypothetical protein
MFGCQSLAKAGEPTGEPRRRKPGEFGGEWRTKDIDIVWFGTADLLKSM